MNQTKRLLSALSAILLGSGAVGRPPAFCQDQLRVQIPTDIGESSLPARREAQLASLPGFQVFHGFSFHDRRPATGITFLHRIVDDAGLRYKAVHYDHGNGIAAADVDGDDMVDLYFLTQLGTNQLWKNVGGGRFKNITEDSAVGMKDRVSVAASFADVDNDGDADLYVTTVRKRNALFENDGRGRFKEITEEAGLAHVGHSSAGLFFDYDNDGLVDLFLANVGVYTTEETGRGGYFVGLDDAFKGHTVPARAERSMLYKNLDGHRFKDVSEQMLLVDRSWSGDAVPTDFNADGFPDLYVLNMQGSDHYYENVGGRFFVDRTDKLFPRTPAGTMGAKYFDWNNDGLFDLFLTDMHSDMVEDVGPEREKLKARMPDGAVGLESNILGNAFFENTGSGFQEISDRIGAENYWPWGVSVDDLNADGWDDLFVTASMNFPFRYGINSVLLNNRGKSLLDSEFILGVEPREESLTQPWFELDCASEEAFGEFSMQGWEIFGASALAPPEVGKGKESLRHPLCGDGSAQITVWAARGSRSSVIVDLEGDGDLDVVTNEFNFSPQVLVSDLSANKKIRFLKLKLRGMRSNADGLGAKVTVVTRQGSQVKVNDGKSGYLSQSRLPLYFGLGESDSVERVEVRWPSGLHQVVTEVTINGLTTIIEPEAPS